jgi:hypothetical protein
VQQIIRGNFSAGAFSFPYAFAGWRSFCTDMIGDHAKFHCGTAGQLI